MDEVVSTPSWSKMHLKISITVAVNRDLKLCEVASAHT